MNKSIIVESSIHDELVAKKKKTFIVILVKSQTLSVKKLILLMIISLNLGLMKKLKIPKKSWKKKLCNKKKLKVLFLLMINF